ncbi:MAG: hypothetical protein WCH31_00350 [Actinomycetes bacterium]
MKKQHKVVAVCAALALVVVSSALAASASTTKPSAKAAKGTRSAKTAPVTFAVFGDSPYGLTNNDVTQSDATPRFIDAINKDTDVSAVMHIGDLHSGKQMCTRTYDEAIFQMWKGFKKPLVYTPGDNEWADCHKVAQSGGAWNATTGKIDFVVDAAGNPVDFGAGDPVANLLLVRSTFFRNPGWTLGKGAFQVTSQALAYDRKFPADSKFVENVMWEQAGVLFVTVNIPGGSNNEQDVWYGAPTMSSNQRQEAVERTDADERWLEAAFAKAKADKVAGVVIGSQADMWDPEKGVDHQTGYNPLVAAVAQGTKDFGKPVLMINGDSHVFRSDNPLSPSATCVWENTTACVSDWYIHPAGGYNIPNFHRIVVHGSTSPMEYLKLAIDPAANAANGDYKFGPFSWSRATQQLP